MPTDTTLYFEQAGTGPDLVLLHGLGSNVGDWFLQRPAFEPAFRVTAFDQRGHGKSATTPPGFSTEDMARDVLAALDAAGIESAHVLGMSMGGMVAQHLALLAPDRVRSLVLVATAASVRPLSWAGRKQRWLRRWVVPLMSMEKVGDLIGERLFPDPGQEHLADHVRAGWMRNDKAGYVAATRAVLAHEVADRLGEIRCPTLVVNGSLDATFDPRLTDELVAGIEGALHEVIEGSRHATPVDAAERFNEVVLGFLGEQ